MKIDHPAATDARVEERPAVDSATFAAEIASRDTPIVLRGQVAHWASVRAALGGDRSTAQYLAGLGDGGKPMEVLIGGPEFGGRFFYRGDNLEGFNFHREQASLRALLSELLRLSSVPERERHRLYANAATASEHLPGWAAANPLDWPLGGGPRGCVSATDRRPRRIMISRRTSPAWSPDSAASRCSLPTRSAIVSRPARPDAGRAAREHGRSAGARPGSLPTLCRGARSCARRDLGPGDAEKLAVFRVAGVSFARQTNCLTRPFGCSRTARCEAYL
jgi:hypothetical protein